MPNNLVMEVEMSSKSQLLSPGKVNGPEIGGSSKWMASQKSTVSQNERSKRSAFDRPHFKLNLAPPSKTAHFQPTDKALFRFSRNIEDIDLESQANKLEETKQVIDHLENQVNSYHDQSEAQLKDVNALFEKTKSSGQVSYILPVILSVIFEKYAKMSFRMLKIF